MDIRLSCQCRRAPHRRCAERLSSVRPSRSAGHRQIKCKSTSADDFVYLRKVAEQAAYQGSLVVSDALDKPRNIEYKGATDLVTETDKAAEAACLAVIQAAFPDHAILGEEGGTTGDTSSEYLWCIDPLDGTTNFAHSYPSFAVSVGVLQHARPVASCVVEFVGGPKAWNTRTFAAHRNGGATCNGEAITVSNVTELQRSLLVTGFGYEHDEPWAANMQLFKEFTDITQGVRRLGAAAVDLCHVSLGLVDAYWEYRLKPWDVCAGVLIVEESGGEVTTMAGSEYSVFERSLLASNKELHGQILAKTKPATDKLLSHGIDLSPWFIPEGYSVGDANSKTA